MEGTRAACYVSHREIENVHSGLSRCFTWKKTNSPPARPSVFPVPAFPPIRITLHILFFPCILSSDPIIQQKRRLKGGRADQLEGQVGQKGSMTVRAR